MIRGIGREEHKSYIYNNGTTYLMEAGGRRWGVQKLDI
jgi:hypothetical protein